MTELELMGIFCMAGKVGKPRIDIEQYVADIKPYLELGCSIHESCVNAEIPYRTVMDYYERDKEIRRKIDRFKNHDIFLARQSVINGMTADPKLAMDYLKNKKSDEFSTKEKQEHTGKDGEAIEVKNININFVKPKGD